MNIIEVKNLTRKFDDFTAVDHVSFEVGKGMIFGFLGPNGAGKSTTINMLATLISPTEGDAKISGFSVKNQRDQVRKSIGLVFQDPSLDDRLTAGENLRFHADLYNVPRKEQENRIRSVLELVDLWERKDDIVRTFSGGMKRRLEISRGLIHHPELLFLDEPTLGLDPQTRFNIWEYILKLKKQREMSIFLTTHYMNEAEYCDQIAVMDHGKIIAMGSPDELKNKVGGDIITLASEEKVKLKAEIETKYSLKVKEQDGFLQIEVPQGDTFLPKLFNELQTKIDSIELRKPTLEDVFLTLTGRKIREELASEKEIMRQRRARHHQ